MFEAAGVILLLAVVAVAAAIFDEMSMRTLSGQVRVVDGDTLVIDGQRIRLVGIDAPEIDQTCRRGGADYRCGREARLHLVELTGKDTVACNGNERDRYGRFLARCVSGQTDLNAAMVLAGWAVSYGDYLREESAARNRSAGLWAGAFERPAEWRAERGAIVDLAAAGVVERLFWRAKSYFGWTVEREAHDAN